MSMPVVRVKTYKHNWVALGSKPNKHAPTFESRTTTVIDVIPPNQRAFWAVKPYRMEYTRSTTRDPKYRQPK
jgi:hypothetical protein